MPSNPLLAAYVLGAYGWAALLFFAVLFQPMAFGAKMREVDRGGRVSGGRFGDAGGVVHSGVADHSGGHPCDKPT